MTSLQDAADALNRAVQRVGGEALSGPVFGEGFVDALSGDRAAIRKRAASAEPVQGFIVPPHLALAIGDRVFYYESGSEKRVIHALNRNAVQGTGGGSVDLSGLQAVAEKGQPNGYASLDGSGLVPTAQLPATSGGLADHTHAATGTGANGGGDTLAPGTFTFPQATAPFPTTEGQAKWDTDDNVLLIGTGGSAATLPVLGTTAPVDQAIADAASAGSGFEAAKANHRHGMPAAAAPGASAVADTASAGSAATIARSDHRHSRESFGAVAAAAAGDASANGTATTVARSDHKHGLPVAAPVAVGVANAAGSSSSLARADHVHASAAAASPVLIISADISANQNNWDPTDSTDATKKLSTTTASIVVVFITMNAANRTITGLVAKPDTLVYLHPLAQTLTLSDQSASSSAGNQFQTGSADYSLVAPVGVGLAYDPGTNLWRLLDK